MGLPIQKMADKMGDKRGAGQGGGSVSFGRIGYSPARSSARRHPGRIHNKLGSVTNSVVNFGFFLLSHMGETAKRTAKKA